MAVSISIHKISLALTVIVRIPVAGDAVPGVGQHLVFITRELLTNQKAVLVSSDQSEHSIYLENGMVRSSVIPG